MLSFLSYVGRYIVFKIILLLFFLDIVYPYNYPLSTITSLIDIKRYFGYIYFTTISRPPT